MLHKRELCLHVFADTKISVYCVFCILYFVIVTKFVFNKYKFSDITYNCKIMASSLYNKIEKRTVWIFYYK